MRIFFTLMMVLLASVATDLRAQFRYIDASFEVTGPIVDTFGTNIDPFQLTLAQNGVPAMFTEVPRPLEMDVYQPADDETDLRPVVVVFPTGNFLPRFVNNGVLGTNRDSAVVGILKRLVSRGYVGIAAEYRQGWNPQSPLEDVRTSTLLQAAYRGGQDAHTMARFLRKTVAEEGNPYGIDTSRIVFWGLGTGGYVTMTHAFLDNIDEVLADDRFYDLNDLPYVSLAVSADPQGLMPAQFAPNVPSNIPNHVGYSSDVALSINSGGALGDLDWIEGKDNEPMVMATHYLRDGNAPFSFGNVIIPVTGELVIGGVSGSEQIIERANELGINDGLSSANATDLSGIFGELSQTINERSEARKSIIIDADPDDITGFPDFELAHDNLLTIVREDTTAGLYNWNDEQVLRASIAAYNMIPFLPARNADTLINTLRDDAGVLYTAESASAELDTMLAFFLPRAYVGLNLETLVGNNDLLSNAAVGLEVFPNPAGAGFTVRTEEGHPIRSIRVMDLNGRVVKTLTGVNATSRFVNRGSLPRGAYVLQIQLDEGSTARKLILE